MIISFLLLSIINASSTISTSSDSGNIMHWRQKTEAVTELYKLMDSCARAENGISIKRLDNSLFSIIQFTFSKKKIRKKIFEDSMETQTRIKEYLNSNFTFADGSAISFAFNNKNDILNWGKEFGHSVFMPYTVTFSREIQVKGEEFFILIANGRSGIPLFSFYVFRKNKDIWELQTSSEATIREQFHILNDEEKEAVIIETPSGPISELSYTLLLI